MSEFKKLMVNNLSDDWEWKSAENNFDRHYLNINSTDENIPKIIHQIWLGSSFPEEYKELTNTWLENHKDWEYRLWTDKDIEEFNMKNIEQYNNAPNLGTKSDIFRYEILYRYGGIYIDTDFQCLKSFADLTYLNFFTGTGHLETPEIFNGLIACEPNHPIMKSLIDGISGIDTKVKDYNKIISMTGPKYFAKMFFNYIKNNPDDKVVLFPTKFFYAFPAVYRFAIRNGNRKIIQQYLNEYSYCVHLWYTSWQK